MILRQHGAQPETLFWKKLFWSWYGVSPRPSHERMMSSSSSSWKEEGGVGNSTSSTATSENWPCVRHCCLQGVSAHGNCLFKSSRRFICMSPYPYCCMVQGVSCSTTVSFLSSSQMPVILYWKMPLIWHLRVYYTSNSSESTRVGV